MLGMWPLPLFQPFMLDVHIMYSDTNQHNTPLM